MLNYISIFWKIETNFCLVRYYTNKSRNTNTNINYEYVNATPS